MGRARPELKSTTAWNIHGQRWRLAVRLDGAGA